MPILSCRFATRFDSAITRSVLYQVFDNRLGPNRFCFAVASLARALAGQTDSDSRAGARGDVRRINSLTGRPDSMTLTQKKSFSPSRQSSFLLVLKGTPVVCRKFIAAHIRPHGRSGSGVPRGGSGRQSKPP